MQVPLTTTTYFDNSGGPQKVKIWSNGRRQIVTAPIRPYAYAKTRPMLPCIMNGVKKKLLSNAKLSEKRGAIMVSSILIFLQESYLPF